MGRMAHGQEYAKSGSLDEWGRCGGAWGQDAKTGLSSGQLRSWLGPTSYSPSNPAPSVLVVAAKREIDVAPGRDLVQQLGVVGREQKAVGRGARVRVVDASVLAGEDAPAG
jgi:hypothetical protein